MVATVVRHFKKAADHPGSELGQGLLRVAVNIPFSIFGWQLLAGTTLLPNPLLFFAVGNFNALLILLHIIWRPNPNDTRRILGTINDQLLITYFLYYIGLTGAVYFFVFSFLTVGNGFRYGGRYLAFSGLLGGAGILTLIFLSPAWVGHTDMGCSVLLSHIMVSGYTGLLLHRLRTTQQRELKSHSILSSIIENSPSVIFVKDADGRYLLVNKKFEQNLGFTADQVIGKTGREIYPAEFAKDYAQHDKLVLESKSHIQHEEIAPHPDGLHSYFTVRFPIRNPSGEIVGIGGIATDVTENKKFETERAELRIRERTAVEASLMKSSFLANMSHELRTPLHGIMGMADLLRSTILTAEQKSFNDTVTQCAESLLTLVNDILDLSKAEAGKIELESIDFDLHKVTTDLDMMLQLAAQRKGLRLSFQIEDNVPQFLKADPTRIRQVLLNLLTNAIKFTDSGYVSAVIRAERREDKIYLRCEVQDTGIGVKEEARERLFMPFSQADASTTRKFGGTGLGLSISKRLVDLMKGEIGVQARLGGGTTFWFTLPVIEVGQLAPGPEAVALPYLHHALKVLVVEDNRVNQMLAIRMLQTMGHQNRVVNNGLEALMALNQSHYDLILMDCHMPEMDGLEATRMIRAGKTLGPRDTRIIALTANAMAGDRERCLEAGMNDYVAKPMKISDLQSAIDRVMAKPTG